MVVLAYFGRVVLYGIFFWGGGGGEEFLVQGFFGVLIFAPIQSSTSLLWYISFVRSTDK